MPGDGAPVTGLAAVPAGVPPGTALCAVAEVENASSPHPATAAALNVKYESLMAVLPGSLFPSPI
jgi:hypothetical protein